MKNKFGPKSSKETIDISNSENNLSSMMIQDTGWYQITEANSYEVIQNK